MNTSRLENESLSKLYQLENTEASKSNHHLLIWENSQEALKYHLRKYNLIHLYDDTAQIYFEILKKYLDSYDYEKASFDFWNRKAFQKSIIKSVRFARSYRVYRENVEGKNIQKHEVRPSSPIDENKLSTPANQTLPDNITKILNIFLQKRILSKIEVRILFYKYKFKFSNIFIAKLLNTSHESIRKTSSKSMDKMRFYMLVNPQMFGR